MICGKCNREFKAGRMGVIVKVVRLHKDGTSVRFRHGDESVCPECGAVVISSMGLSYEGETRAPDYTVKV